MDNQPLHVKFQNRQNPKSGFDSIAFENLLKRTDLDHSPFEHHLVEFFIILFITEGTGKHSIDFVDYEYEKGTVFTIRKDQIQKFYPGNRVKGNMLLFTTEFLVSFFNQQESQKTVQLFNELLGSPKLQLTEKRLSKTLKQLKRIHEEYFITSDAYSLAVIRSELQILIARLFRIKSQNDSVLYSHEYLNDFIRFQNSAEAKITTMNKVSDYSDELGYNTKTLNKLTKATVHKTAKEFLDEIHLKQIKRLLINSTASIKEIAYQSGFNEPTNFYKFFKRTTGLTPEQFHTQHT